MHTPYFLNVLARVLFLLCCTGIANASNNSLIIDENDAYYAGRYAYLFTDSKSKLSFKEIQQIPVEQWEHSDEEIISKGMLLGTTWVKLSIFPEKKALDEDKNWQLNIEYAMPYAVELYYQDVNGQWHITRGGSGIPFNQRPVKDQLIVFDLPLNGNVVNQIYLRVDARSPVLLPIRITTEEARLEWKENRSMWLNIYYGMLLIMFIYNLLLGFSMRNNTYFLISVYIVSLLAFAASMDGCLDQYFWPNLGMETIKTVNVITQWVEIWVLLLIKYSFKTKERFPKIDKLFSGLVVIISIMLPTNIVTSSIVSSAFSISMSMFAFPFICYTLIDSFINKYEDVRYMSFAWSFFAIFTMIQALVFSGVVPTYSYSLYLIHIGSCLMVMALSFALAEQIAYYKWQKLNTERESRVKEQNANKVLDAINRKLSRSNELKDQFLSAISHELRTPMNGVIGALDLIDIDYLPAKYRDPVEIANRSAEEMMRLVDDLLCYCDLQNDTSIQEKSVFNLEPLLASLLEEMKPKLDSKHVALELDLPKDISFSLLGNDQIMIQALYQLLDNAIKFTEKGIVRLEVKIEELSENDEVQIVFRVTDTGIGIEESRIESLFSAFSQADGSHTRKYGGLGIGLSICHKALERIGGHMEVTSDLGKGSSFTIIIPMSKTEQIKPLVSEGAQHPAHLNNNSKDELQAAGKEGILALVVEDNIVNQKVMVGMLKKLNIPSKVVANGLEAVEVCEREHFDLILMDCQMPIMDGLEATRKIRSESAKNQYTPIIAVTANVLDIDERVCKTAGMNEYFKKPVKLSNIRAVIDSYLNKKPNLNHSTQMQ